MNSLCQLCRCDRATSVHHLIPRTLHSNKWFRKRFTRQQMRAGIHVCRDCQRMIHRLIPDEKEMGRNYNTLEKLRAHPEVAKYVAWKRRRRM